ncbi:MAG: terminase large subunit domain-containing protein [Gemmatimonadales bacterium]
MSLQRSLRRALDPSLLFEAVGLEADPWQRQLLVAPQPQTILCCSRQAGKSLVSAALAVDEAIHRPPALVLILAPALRQSQESFRKVKRILAGLGPDAPPLANESALSLETVAGSRIVCLPGKEATVRGYSSVGLLIVDEAAKVVDDLYMSVRPMLSVSRGRILLLSTPFGRRGFFHHEWEEGGREWERVKITAYDVPRIERVWLEAERNRIGDWWFRQEYLCEFVETEDQVFHYSDVVRAGRADIQPLFPLSGVAA